MKTKFQTALFLIFFSASFLAAQTEPRREVLGDKVERYYRPKAANAKPWFFQQVENLFNVILPPKDQLPFGVSVAFLVGVSQYDYLSPQLPFVKNDLRDMRDFLLNQGGFDTVYVAAERVVNRDLIDDYMRNRFVKRDQRDRLLFYYAGHGDDDEGSTGYMQFAQARPKNFVGTQISAINIANEWSSTSRLRHMLFIFDCCSSGLAFSPRGDFSSLEVLSRDPCRIALTAGTANQQTFEVNGNGVFTRAFLNAAKTGIADKGNNGFMTIEEIFAYIKDEVAGFSARSGKPLTPQPWQLLDRAKYRGTFVFVNPEAKSRDLKLSEKYAQALNAQPRRGESVAAVGIVQLTSYLTGQVYLDNTYMGEVENGDVRKYENVKVGSHEIVIKGANETAAQTVPVVKGKVTPVTLRSQGMTPSYSLPVENKPVASNPAPCHSLRATKRDNLSEKDVKATLFQNNFYTSEYSWNEAYSNPQGRGLPNEFEVQQDGKVVFDRVTCLMWQLGGSQKTMTYEKVNDYVKQLNKNRFAGFNDWRLPTLEEAMSLMERRKIGELYIDSKFDTEQWWIWTSDTYVAGAAWSVHFGFGNCRYQYFGAELYGRAVRSGSERAQQIAQNVPETKYFESKVVPSHTLRSEALDNLSEAAVKSMLRENNFYSTDAFDWSKEWSNPQGKGLPNDFEVQQNGKVILDRATGLVWQQSGSPESMTYELAKAYVARLNHYRFAGFSDWRLPTLEEAMSLMEPQKNSDDLYIDPKFDKTQTWIWTADTPSAGRAWFVAFYYGHCSHVGVGGVYYVRAVRS